MFRALGFAVAAALVPIPAFAYDWSGFYFGAHAGYGSTEFDGRETIENLRGDAFQIADFSDSGATFTVSDVFALALQNGCDCSAGDGEGLIYGFHAGYNWQSGSFVFGIEAGATAGSLGANETNSGMFDDVLPPFGQAVGSALSLSDFDPGSIWTFRGRAGAVYDRLLVYGSAGIAVSTPTALLASNANIQLVDTDDFGVSTIFLEGDDTLVGWTLGAGVEYALTEKVSLRLDYQHVSFDGFSLQGFEAFSTPVTAETSFGVDLIQTGLNFRF